MALAVSWQSMSLKSHSVAADRYTADVVNCGLRERKKEATRAVILQVALDLFERDGYDATTVEDIAAAAGVSPRTFFRYFDAKIDLVIERKDPGHGGQLRAFISARPADEHPMIAMREVARLALLASLAEGGDALLRQIRVMLATPSLRASALEHFNDHRTEIRDAFAERLGVGSDELAPRVLAAVLPETLWVVVETWVRSGAIVDELGPLIDDAFAVLHDGVPVA